MNPSASDWNTEFDRWLKPFLDALGHKARQRWASPSLRGLIAPGDRKSIGPSVIAPHLVGAWIEVVSITPVRLF